MNDIHREILNITRSKTFEKINNKYSKIFHFGIWFYIGRDISILSGKSIIRIIPEEISNYLYYVLPLKERQ
jgi:restriction endonuclease S subunit